ncbi:MAG: cytochrome c3 family protein [Acidobacteriota bacterium]
MGYEPVQPVPYSHKLHAGNLGMDCRYCHSTVETSNYAAIPAAETCMNCHTRVKPKSELLEPVRESYASGKPVPWVRIHKLPDYVYFSHQAHVGAGVSCVSCHGRVDQMAEVRQVKPLSMAWCLECHRDPAANIRPRDQVTNLAWKPTRDPAEIGRELMAKNKIHPPTNCSGCHR